MVGVVVVYRTMLAATGSILGIPKFSSVYLFHHKHYKGIIYTSLQNYMEFVNAARKPKRNHYSLFYLGSPVIIFYSVSNSKDNGK